MFKINISIIKATPEHTEDISRICSVGWRQTVKDSRSEANQKETVTYWYNHTKVQKDIKNGTYTHVAIVDYKVVGTIGGIINNKNISEIYVFYVEEKYRYKGIGKMLLDAFTHVHAKHGATNQCVSVEEGNELGTPFYKARGFQLQEGEKRYSRKISK